MTSEDQSLNYHVKDRDPGVSLSGDVPYKDALDFTIPTLVRESLQNALDAGTGSGPVEVVYRFERLEGDELEEFQEALDWEAYRDHLENFVGADTSLRVREFLDHLDSTGQLDVLVVEDRNTSGLPGGEIEDDTPYNALVRDTKITVKEDDGSGGSHGVGKAVFPGFSLPSLVTYHSNLAEDPDASPRLVGRGLLPDHRRADKRVLDGEEIWFGTDDPSVGRPVSVWGDQAEAIAERLRLSRPDVSGTSVAIVGFGAPDGQIPPDVDETVDEMRRAVARNFWPALEMGHLTVKIKAHDGTEHTVGVADAPEIEPFVQTFRQFQDADEELGPAGDVARTEIDFQFEPAGGEEVEGRATVGVRVPTAADMEHDELLNHVAIFRGRGMVVDYLDRSKLTTRGREFHAILAAGLARTWPEDAPCEDDEAVELFLRAAEPAEHDEWDNTPKLQDKYVGACAGTVRALQGRDLKEALLPLIKVGDDREGDRVPALSALFDLGLSGSGPGPDPRGDLDSEIISGRFDVQTSQWVYEVRVGPDDPDVTHWEAWLGFERKGDDNRKAGELGVVDVDLVDPAKVDRCEVVSGSDPDDVATVIVEAEGAVGEVTLRLRSVELPSIDPRTGDLGVVSLSVQGDVETSDGGDA